MLLDDIRNYVDQARNIAVTKCSCRAIEDGGKCGTSLWACMQLNRAADYALERGTGRKLTKEEAVALLEQCEEEGLVHVADNKMGIGNVICNCCSDCCLNWTPMRNGVGKLAAPSRFQAVIADSCNGCEMCIDRCMFDALVMADNGSAAKVDADKCMGCGVCRPVCSLDAISMELVRPQDFIPGEHHA
jgi:ferredoxin